MSPHRQAHIERWQVVAAFVVVTIVFTIALFWTQHASTTAKHAAQRATAADIRTRDLLRRERADRQARRRQNIETLLLICEKQNASNHILADLITRIGKLPAPPSATAEQTRIRKKLYRVFALELRRLKPHTCRNLPAIQSSR